MLKTIKSFMTNRDFHNPLRADGSVRLLSAKETFKGKVAPWATMAAMAGMNVAVAALTGSLSWVLPAVGVIMACRYAHALYTERKLKPPDEGFDFSDPARRADFSTAYGQQHAAFPGQFLAIARKCGLAKAPPIHIVSGNKLFGSPIGAINDSRGAAILVKEEEITNSTCEVLLASAAHEMGHLGQGHHRQSRWLSSLSAAGALTGVLAGGGIAVSLASGILPAVVMGAGVLVFAIGYVELGGIMANKLSQYQEREADRVALVATGLAREFAQDFITEADREILPSVAHFKKNNPGHGFTNAQLHFALKEIIRRDTATKRGLLAKHPQHSDRADYIEKFAEVNADFCRVARAGFNFPDQEKGAKPTPKSPATAPPSPSRNRR